MSDSDGRGVASRVQRTMLERISRREAVRRGTILGLAVPLVAGILTACGDDDDDPADPGDVADDEDLVDEPDDEDEDEDDVDEQDQYGGELLVGLSADPPSLDPHVGVGYAAIKVKLQFYNGLMRHWAEDGTYELQPDLTEDVEISDDGITYTFNLREGVVFHDGEAFTSADVEATVERIRDDATGAARQREMLQIESMQSPDDLTVEWTLVEANAAMLSHLASEGCFIISKRLLDEDLDPELEVIGTGPFMLEDREPGVRIDCVRNPNYFREGQPYLDRVTFIPYPDEDTRVTAALTHDVDLIDYVPWKDYDQVEAADDVTLLSGDAGAFMYIIHNLNFPDSPFADRAVRYALAYAYDRQAVSNLAFHGRGSIMTGGLIPPGFWAHHEGIEGHFSYDPDRARELLEEAGYGDGFSVRLMSTSQYAMHQDTAESVQANLRDVGVECELELYDWSTVTERDVQGEFQFRIQGASPGEGDPDVLSSYFHSEFPSPRRYGFGNEEIDGLLDDARQLVSEEERKPLYDEAQELLLEQQWITYLTFREQGHAVRVGVHGFEHFPGGVFQYSGRSFEQVWIESS
jgi:glutathione transport system substrate-binding protein